MVCGLFRAQELSGYYGNLPAQPAAICRIPLKEWLLSLLDVPQAQSRWRMTNKKHEQLATCEASQEKESLPVHQPSRFAHIRGSLTSVPTLRSGNSALHFYVGELRNILCALGDGRDDMLKPKKHCEEQDEKNGQEAQKQSYIHVQVGILVRSGVNVCCQSGEMSPPREISMILKMHLRHHSRLELIFAPI